MFYNKLKDDKNLLFVRQTARKLTAVSSITFLLSIKLESVTSYHCRSDGKLGDIISNSTPELDHEDNYNCLISLLYMCFICISY